MHSSLAFTANLYFKWNHTLLTIFSCAHNCLLILWQLVVLPSYLIHTYETHQAYDHLIGEEVGEPCCSADESLLAEKGGGGAELTFCDLLPQHGQSTAS